MKNLNVNMTREDAQPAWEKIVNIGLSNYESLTINQRVWFNTEPLTTSGIIDHYINHGAQHNMDTINDVKLLGFDYIAELLRKINGLFENGQPPRDVDERNNEIASWDGKYNNFLDDIDEKYWERNSNLERALLEHINKTGIAL